MEQCLYVMYTASGKRDQQYFVRNTDKFKCIVVIFQAILRMSLPDYKYGLQLFAASLNQRCYFILQNEMRAMLAYYSTIKTDQVQEDSCGLQIRYV